MTQLFPDPNDGGLLYQAPPVPEPELWHDYKHTCDCAYLGQNAPCGHCTDCPECNCQRCREWHDTAAGETCPKLHPIQEEGHTMTNLPTKLEAAQLVQYGLRFPNGRTRWAAGAISFDTEGDVKIPGSLTTVPPASYEGLDLKDALAGENTLSHLIARLRKVAEDANADADAYLAGVRIVKRTLIVLAGEDEVHELPPVSSPLTAQQAHETGRDPWG